MTEREPAEPDGRPTIGVDERHLRELVDALPQTVFVIDLEARFTFVNGYGLAAFGYTAADLERGLSVFDVIAPADHARLRENLARRLSGAVPEYQEFTGLRRDGSTCLVVAHAAPVLAEGRLVGFQGFLVDVTARKAAERALVESERKYRAILEATATGFVILDHTGRVLDANAEYVRLTGRASLADLVGRRVLEWVAPHHREAVARQIPRTLEQRGASSLTFDYAKPSGEIVPVEINAAVIGEGDERRILGIVRDVTERRRHEAEMLRAEKLRSVGVLAGGIAHDFNNILTGIVGSLSLVTSGGRLEAEDAELVAGAEQAAWRARELTRQLLTFSRGGAPVRRLVDPVAIVRENATLALRGRGSGLEFEAEGEVWPLEADEGQLGQLVNNLVINASQAMAGGGTVRVTLGNGDRLACEAVDEGRGRCVVLAVSDGGAGIPEEHLERIFDPYFTTKQEGSGLGLAVCYAVVQNHGGSITVRSSPGAGATFTVVLPAATGTADGPPRAERTLPRGSGRVLVMDDDALIRSVAGRILKALGYEFTAVAEGRSALEAWAAARAEGRPFDAAIFDLTVPGGMGGLEAVRELLAQDPAARVIVSSGYHQDPIMASHREHGFRDVVTKPFGALELGRVVARVIAGGERDPSWPG